MLAYKEWYTLFQDGKLNDIQSQFFKPKSPESLYNIEEDPHETKNLANDIAYNDGTDESNVPRNMIKVSMSPKNKKLARNRNRRDRFDID